MFLLIADLQDHVRGLCDGIARESSSLVVVEAGPPPLRSGDNIAPDVCVLSCATALPDEDPLETSEYAYPKVPPFSCRVPESAPRGRPRRTSEADGGFG